MENNTKLKTGFTELDNFIDLEKNNLIIISGASAIGKTSLALNVVTNVLKQNKSVLIFSLEMAKEEINAMLISQEGLIDIDKIREKKLDDEEMDKLKIAEKQIKGLKLYINDKPRNYNKTNRETMY